MKKIMARIAVLCSAMVLALGLVACGGNGGSDSGSGSEPGPASGGSAPAPAADGGSAAMSIAPFTAADYGTYVITGVAGSAYAELDDSQRQKAANDLREDDYQRIIVADSPVLYYSGDKVGTFTLTPQGDKYQMVMGDEFMQQYGNMLLSFENGRIILYLERS